MPCMMLQLTINMTRSAYTSHDTADYDFLQMTTSRPMSAYAILQLITGRLSLAYAMLKLTTSSHVTTE